MFMFFLSMNMILSIMFLFMNHPMSMGLILLLQTIIVSLVTGMMTFNFWFSCILFLVMIGGMLVLFIYMTSLASNEMFNLSIKLTLFFMMFTSTMMIFNFLMDSILSSILVKNSSMLEMNSLLNMTNENLITLSKIYNPPNNLLTMILINYLLLTLIAVVKITNINYGPLRQKFEWTNPYELFTHSLKLLMEH